LRRNARQFALPIAAGDRRVASDKFVYCLEDVSCDEGGNPRGGMGYKTFLEIE